MTPLLTVNLLRVLFVTFCGVVARSSRSKRRGTPFPAWRVATVVLSSALQTGGGRLIFAELKENSASVPSSRFYNPTAPRTRAMTTPAIAFAFSAPFARTSSI